MGNQQFFSSRSSSYRELPTQSYINYVVKKHKDVWEKSALDLASAELDSPKPAPKPKTNLISRMCCCLTADDSDIEELVWLSTFKSECLKSRKTYEWPHSIASILHSFNPDNKVLQMYLSDIQWFDYQQGIYEVNKRKAIKYTDSSNSRSANNSFDYYRSQNSQPLIESEIKAMLMNTQIINEEFYHATRNVKEYEAVNLRQTNKMSLRGSITDNNKNGNNPSINKPGNCRHYSSCCLSEYLNNTFIHSGQWNFEENPNFNFMENLEKIEEREKQEQSMLQMKKCLFHYKGITERIEQHLKDHKNFVFAAIQQAFATYFCCKYGKILSKKAPVNDKLARKKIIDKIEFAFSELKDFMRIFQRCLSLFYKLDEYQSVLKYFLFTRENLQNFLTSLIFDEKIYDIVFSAQQFIDCELENTLVEKLSYIKDSQPSDFEVHDKYCLNEKTIKYFSERKKITALTESQIITETQVFETTETQTRRTSFSNNKFLLELKGSAVLKTDRNENYEEETFKLDGSKYTPFTRAIKNLRKLQKLKSPLHKLKNMRITAEIIDQEIREFYKKFNIESQGNIGAEDILPIHMFIISKANLPTLFTHCAIIDRFLSSNLTGSITGYYLVTMQVCLKYILSLNKNGLLEGNS